MRGKNQKIVFAVLIVFLAGVGFLLHSLAQGSLRRELTEKRKKVEVELNRLREANAEARAAADEAAAKEKTTRNEAKKAEAEKAKSENERAAAEAKAAAQKQEKENLEEKRKLAKEEAERAEKAAVAAEAEKERLEAEKAASEAKAKELAAQRAKDEVALKHVAETRAKADADAARALAELKTAAAAKEKSENDLKIQESALKEKQKVRLGYLFGALGLLAIALIIMILLLRQRALRAQIESEKTKNQFEAALKKIKVYVTALALTEQITASTLYFQLDDDSWDDFMNLINLIYNDFNKRLIEKYPSLTKEDLHICSLTRLGFNNQVIAILLNQQTNSYARRKSRIKQEKMGGNEDTRSFEEILEEI